MLRISCVENGFLVTEDDGGRVACRHWIAPDSDELAALIKRLVEERTRDKGADGAIAAGADLRPWPRRGGLGSRPPAPPAPPEPPDAA